MDQWTKAEDYIDVVVTWHNTLNPRSEGKVPCGIVTLALGDWTKKAGEKATEEKRTRHSALGKQKQEGVVMGGQDEERQK